MFIANWPRLPKKKEETAIGRKTTENWPAERALSAPFSWPKLKGRYDHGEMKGKLGAKVRETH